MTPNSSALPRRLEAARRRFEAWRSTRQGKDRIPQALWRRAAICGSVYGVYRTARALGLDYQCLKRRVSGLGAPAARSEKAPTFFEVPSIPAQGRAECVVELESPRGTKIRLELWGRAVPDVLELARRFEGEER
ncbi:MAG TPA: hypothetical protein VMT52_05330 [Planctomycetota bacterium]|nr:hypothetical protein [Planctomycetota bacterium]